MTVSPTTTETVYTLTGSSVGPFSTDFPYAVASDIKVYLDQGLGPTLLDPNADYALTGATPLVNGGEVTLDGALVPSGGWPDSLQPGGPVGVDKPTVILRRDTPDGQPSSFGEADGFSPAQWEAALDNLSRQVQERQQETGRCLQFPFGEAGWQLPDEIAREDKLFGFDDLGEPHLYPLTTLVVHVTFFDIPFQFLGGTPPNANEVAFIFVADRDMTIPGDFAGMKGWNRNTDPADQVMSITKNGAAAGSLTIAAGSRVWSGSTTGHGEINLVAGDVLVGTWPATPPTTLADCGWQITGTLG